MVQFVFNAQNGLFITGFECLTRRQNVIKLSTGSKALDTLLGGGIETQSSTQRLFLSYFEVTEASGEFRTGRSENFSLVTLQARLKSLIL